MEIGTVALPFNEKDVALRLEEGIEKLSFLTVESRYHLRMPWCGIASYAVNQYLETMGYATRLVSITAKSKFDDEMVHVMSEVDIDRRSVYIDSTYSQFFDYVGLTPWYAEAVGEHVYPDEKIIAFERRDRSKVVGAVARHAYAFQSQNVRPLSRLGVRVGHGPLDDARLGKLSRTYASIWNPRRFKPLVPEDELVRAGREVAEYLISTVA